MDDDVLELVAREQARALDGRVPRLDVLERAVREVGGEDDVDDVPARRARDRARSSRRARPAPRTARRPRSRAPRAARAAAPRSASRRTSTPPPGRSQYSLPGFSCRQSRTRPCQRRIAETRMRGSISGATIRSRGTPRSRLRQLVDLDELELRERRGSRAARSACPARRRTARRGRC